MDVKKEYKEGVHTFLSIYNEDRCSTSSLCNTGFCCKFAVTPMYQDDKSIKLMKWYEYSRLKLWYKKEKLQPIKEQKDGNKKPYSWVFRNNQKGLIQKA